MLRPLCWGGLGLICLSLVPVSLAQGAPGDGTPSDGADNAQPAWLERWLYNARERTQRGIEAFAEDPATALAHFESAGRLAAEHPVAAYNVGTSRLLTGSEGAGELLEQASIAGLEALGPRAPYNLGNALLQAEDLSGAVEAYQEALRLDPDHRNAKLNLEWALRKIEEESSGGESPQEEEQDESEGEEEQESPPPPPPEPGEGDEEQEDQEEQQNDPQQNQEESALPQFSDLPDMTAAEAAEILEAVENLEREERRQQAMQAAATRSEELKDW